MGGNGRRRVVMGGAHSNSQVIGGDVDGSVRLSDIVDGRMGKVEDVKWVGCW